MKKLISANLITVALLLVPSTARAQPDNAFYFRYSKGDCDGLCINFSAEIRDDNYLHLESVAPIEGSTRWRIRLSDETLQGIAAHIEKAPVLHQAAIDCTGIGLGERVTMLVYRASHFEFSRHIDFNCAITPETEFKHALRELENLLPIWDLISEMGQ